MEDRHPALGQPALALALPDELHARGAHDRRRECAIGLQRGERLDRLAEPLLVGEQRAPLREGVADRRALKRPQLPAESVDVKLRVMGERQRDRRFRASALDLERLHPAGGGVGDRDTGEAGPGHPIARLKISLIGVRSPPVWRRVVVPADIPLDRLHDVIQTTLGWLDCHLHAFSAAGVDYGPPDPDFDLGLDHRDGRKATLARLAPKPGDRLRYAFDFGDDWEHEILVERLLSAEAGVRYPSCTGGSGRRPPEDCGGPPGYAFLREALADPDHDEHARMLDWLGLDSPAQFDPTAFDVDEVNALL